jgi:hypothetical protein
MLAIITISHIKFAATLRPDAGSEFFNEMVDACEASSDPVECDGAAFEYYIGVRIGGGSAYAAAQQSGCKTYPNPVCPSPPPPPPIPNYTPGPSQ